MVKSITNLLDNLFYKFYLELSKTNSFAEREALLHNLDDPHWQSNLQDDKFPEYKPNFGALRLSRKSSLADFVNDGNATGGLGLLVSEKALNVLQKLRLPPNRAYPLETIQNDKKISAQYYWLQILAVQFSNWIDFSASDFFLTSTFQMEADVIQDIVKINNGVELHKIMEAARTNDQHLHFSKLVLNAYYHQAGYDLFWLDPLGGFSSGYPIVNDRFKRTLEEYRLIGYQLKELPIAIVS